MGWMPTGARWSSAPLGVRSTSAPSAATSTTFVQGTALRVAQENASARTTHSRQVSVPTVTSTSRTSPERTWISHTAASAGRKASRNSGQVSSRVVGLGLSMSPKPTSTAITPHVTRAVPAKSGPQTRTAAPTVAASRTGPRIVSVWSATWTVAPIVTS